MDIKKRVIEMLEHGSFPINNMICVEELAELQKEVSKMFRCKGSKQNLLEEMADVSIVLEMLKVLYGIDDSELEEEVTKKMARNMERIWLK